MRSRAFVLALVPLAALAAPARAFADADETSVHAEATGGAVQLGDPAGGGASTVALVGGAVRFTAATRDWFAWQLQAYGGATSAGQYTFDSQGTARELSRGAIVAGLDAGATLRLGVRYIPTATLAIGPQLRLLPEARLVRPDTGVALGTAAADHRFDLTARLSVGLDVRLGPRLVIGARAGVRQALGLAAGSWRSFEGTLQVAYYWYGGYWDID